MAAIDAFLTRAVICGSAVVAPVQDAIMLINANGRISCWHFVLRWRVWDVSIRVSKASQNGRECCILVGIRHNKRFPDCSEPNLQLVFWRSNGFVTV